jgi:hypothetical protein
MHLGLIQVAGKQTPPPPATLKNPKDQTANPKETPKRHAKLKVLILQLSLAFGYWRL